MKLPEFMTCWRECVPAEYPIDLEQLKVNYFHHISSLNQKQLLCLIVGICDYF
jgi:hypothetical protein